MAQVFISYKHEDGDFAEVLKGKLKKARFETWMDSDIQGGEKWSPAIDTAIENSFALIVIMSPEARQSEFITYEWSLARGLGKEIVPIMLKLTDLHPKLAEFQYIDFTNRNARPWDKLIARLKALAKAKSVSVTSNKSILNPKSPNTNIPTTQVSVQANGILGVPFKQKKHRTLTKYIEELLNDVEQFMLSLGSDVHFEEKENYVACKRRSNFASIIAHSTTILIYAKLSPDDINLELGFTRDMRHRGHHGTGDLEILLNNADDLEKAKPLIKKSYELN